MITKYNGDVELDPRLDTGPKNDISGTFGEI